MVRQQRTKPHYNRQQRYKKPAQNWVGTPNATADVRHYIQEGKTRAPFLRYFRFNLPRLTKAVLLLVMAGLGACLSGLAVNLDGAQRWLSVVIGVAALAWVVAEAFTRLTWWKAGGVMAALSLANYLFIAVVHTPMWKLLGPRSMRLRS